jgi:hypothetical protein
LSFAKPFFCVRGYGCADPDYPGVCARVSEEADWIEQVVCDYSPSSCNQQAPTDAPFPALLSNLPSQYPSEMPTREITMFDSQDSSGNSTVVEIKPPTFEEYRPLKGAESGPLEGAEPGPLKGAESGKTNIFQSFERFDLFTKKIVIMCGFFLIITATAVLLKKGKKA